MVKMIVSSHFPIKRSLGDAETLLLLSFLCAWHSLHCVVSMKRARRKVKGGLPTECVSREMLAQSALLLGYTNLAAVLVRAYKGAIYDDRKVSFYGIPVA